MCGRASTATGRILSLLFFYDFPSQAFRSLGHVWLPFVLNEIKVWQRFHHYWMKAAESLCVLPVRYEDLLSDKEVRSDERGLHYFLIAIQLNYGTYLLQLIFM